MNTVEKQGTTTHIQPLIGIASLGDPRNSKTWSGTPSNIIQAFDKLGLNTLSLDTSIAKYYRAAYWILGQMSGWGRYYFMGKMARSHNTKILLQKIQSTDCKKILHICGGTVTVPITKVDQLEQYLVCDTTWNLWKTWATDIYKLSASKIELAEQLEKEAFTQMKHIFAISEYVRKNLIEHYNIQPERISVIGTGRGGIPPYTGEKNYADAPILFAAKLRFEDKGGPLLLEGFKIAQQKKASLKLVIVGQEKYKKLVDSIPNVTVTGYLPWEELQKFFHTAALFAMPAPNEPWGLVYLEALACKTPILGLNRNSLPEITQNGKYGFLVEQPTPEAVAEAILEAFSNLNKLREMGSAGQEYCLNTFSWNNVASKIAKVMLAS